MPTFIKLGQKIKNLNVNLQSFIAGAICCFSFAPFDLFFPAIFSICWLYYLIDNSNLSNKKSFILGLCFGAGYFLTGNYWISISLLTDIGKFWWLLPFSVTLIPLGLGLFFAIFAAIFNYVNQKLSLYRYQKILLFAFLWLFIEIVRGYIFTGFPWNLIGYSMMFSDYAMQSASIIGVYGLSLFAVLFCLIPVVYNGNKEDIVFGHILLIAFIVNLIFGFMRLEIDAKTESLNKTVRLVQGNIKQNMKWDKDEKMRNFKKHITMSQLGNIDKIDGFIWSETSIPYPIGFNYEVDSEVKKLVTKNNQFLISGALRVSFHNFYSNRATNIFNSIFMFWDRDHKYYDKHHLVPFGEYIPLQKFLPFVKKITHGGDGFSEGLGPKTIKIPGIKISPLVCYEVIFPYNVVEQGTRPDLFVNVTNDAWFLTSSGPFQHLNMSRMRAVEYGISMARVANTGVSAYIDPYGRIVDEISLNEEGYLDVDLIRPLESTFLSLFKYYMLLFILLAMAVLERLYTTTIKSPKNEKYKES